MDEEIVEFGNSLIGLTVTRVFLDQWSCGIFLDDMTVFTINGNWSLKDAESHSIIDCHFDLSNRTEFNLWKVCGTTIVSVQFREEELDNNKIEFNNGLVLLIENSCDGPEDWSIWRDHLAVMYDGGLKLM